MAQPNQDNLFNLLQEMLDEQPHIQTLDLQDQEIDDLNTIYDPLTKFQRLNDLNLSNNGFQTLPSNMSGLRFV